jgi:hypothetical protein
MSSNPEQVILITGARDWSDKELIKTALLPYADKKVLLIHGDCQGADKLSGEVAQELGFDISASPANWKLHGRAAGPIRNREMVNQTKKFKQSGIPTIVFAFHDALHLSKGTKNCVAQAEKAGLKISYQNHGN